MIVSIHQEINLVDFIEFHDCRLGEGRKELEAAALLAAATAWIPTAVTAVG